MGNVGPKVLVSHCSICYNVNLSGGNQTATGEDDMRWLLSLFIFVFATTESAAQSSSLFRTTPAFDVGNGPVSITSCDLNSDGVPDAITADSAFDDVAVLLSDGAGGFLPQVRFGVGDNPQDVVCSDLNNDGNLDVITVNKNSHNISILRGNGDGTFQIGALTVSAIPSQPLAVVAGDVDSNGIVDLIVGSNSRFEVHLGSGSFVYQFNNGQNFGAGNLALRDVDGDGDLDLVAAGSSSSSSVNVFWGAGDGTFPTSLTLTAANTVTAIDVADVDGNTELDILAATTLNSVSIFAAAGNRLFNTSVEVSIGTSPTAIIARDVNSDGFLDLLSSNAASNDVSVRLGHGSVSTFDPEIRFGAGDNVQDFRADDFDTNGTIDIVTANTSSNDASLLLGNGDGTFRWEPRFGVGLNPLAIAACDLNSDGFLDLAAANSSSNDISILLGLGLGRFGAEQRIPVAEVPVSIACAEVTGDTDLDLVVANTSSSEVSVLQGLGDGNFISKSRFTTGFGPDDLAVCDLNEDGRNDIVTANGNDFSILFGNGGGSFLPQVFFPDNAFRIECVDINMDSHLDLVFTGFSSLLTVLLGNGDGTFQSALNSSAGVSAVQGLVVANLDEDADLDAAVVASFAWSPLRGLGVGTFGTFGSAIPTGNSGRDIIASDIDKDGVMDIAITNQGDDDVSIFIGNGNGTYQADQRFGVGEDPRQVVAADVDNDGDDDLIVVNSTSGSISVLFNTVFFSPDDFDGDGIMNQFDNCPTDPNPNQSDFDGDSEGDVCDADIDGDGVVNDVDVCDFTPAGAPVQPDGGLRTDVDGDCDVDLLDFAILQSEFTGP